MTKEHDETPEPKERSAVADDIAELKATTIKLSNDRERLPQPLFWSLFHTRLQKIKEFKELERVVATTLAGVEE